MASQRDTIQRIVDTLYGNGHAGLTTRVNLLEQWANEQRWWTRTTASAIILWVLGQLLGLLK